MSKSQTAYAWLRERIAGHDYGPGRRLVLGEAARALGMSVVPVREAVRRLEAEGLVTFEPHVGARVAVVDEADYVHTMQTLGLLEGAATALAAPLLGRDELARARETNARMTALLDDLDPAAFTRLNRELHGILFAPCPNPHLLDLVHRGWARLAGIRDSTFAVVPERAHGSVAEHERLLDLIADGGDPLDVELAVRHHRSATLDAFRARTTDHHQQEAPACSP